MDDTHRLALAAAALLAVSHAPRTPSADAGRAIVATFPAHWCVADTPGGLQAFACEGVDAPLWFASAAARRAAGADICWWHARAEDLGAIDGVGPSLAERLEDAREAGALAHEGALREIAGVGPATARRIAERVTMRCAMALPR